MRFYQAPSIRPIRIDVITESRKSESISVSFWNRVEYQEWQHQADLTPSNQTLISTNSAEVVLLYAQVLQGELPVLNANVTAIITLPGNSQHGPNTINVQLSDTGSGGMLRNKSG